MKIRGLLDTDKLFAFGGDAENEPPRIETVPERRPKAKPRTPSDDDDDDDDDEFIKDPKDQRIRKLSRESNRRRIANRELTDALAEKDDEISALREQLENASKVQKAFDKLKTDSTKQLETVRRMAIRSAIEKDAVENDKGEPQKRAWYDTNMVESLLDPNQLSVDLNDFSVGGIREQLDAIAEKSPFLVKGLEGSAKNGSQTNGQQHQQPSGQAPQSSATGTGEQNASLEQDKMLGDFPALRSSF